MVNDALHNAANAYIGCGCIMWTVSGWKEHFGDRFINVCLIYTWSEKGKK